MSAESSNIVRHLVELSKGAPGEAHAEFRVGVESAPYLKDHGFQDMVVLPGSFFVEMARCVDRELSRSVPGKVRNVSFRRPVILGNGDARIRVEVKENGDGRAAYTFHEIDGLDDGAGSSGPEHTARLEIDRNGPPAPGEDRAAISLSDLRALSDEVIDADRFYAALSANGNQFGPSFRNVTTIWRAGNETLGKLSIAPLNGSGGDAGFHPGVLDSITQVLASFIVGESRTFVLRAVESIELSDQHLPDTLWVHAEMRSGEEDGGDPGLTGDLRVLCPSGRTHLKLTGVRFSLLDRVETETEEATERFVIASNFTAEPVGESLDFWASLFESTLSTEFAPYDQVFQQLLDKRSALRRNRDGVNGVLLSLEEWAEKSPPAPMQIGRAHV